MGLRLGRVTRPSPSQSLLGEYNVLVISRPNHCCCYSLHCIGRPSIPGRSPMSVFRLKDAAARTLPWRAVVSRKGGRSRLVKHFLSRREAEMWEHKHKKEERMRDVPEHQQTEQLRLYGQCTVKDLVQDYLAARPAIHPSNLTMLRQFMRDPLASKSLLELTRQDVNRFIARRLTDTWKPPNSKGEPKQITPRTVRRHINIFGPSSFG
jgi:hypothetical protein